MFGLHRDTVRKMLEYSVPPGYRRQSPPRRPKLDPYRGVIDRILEDDRSLPKKQRHTAKRIYERLRAEHGFDGKYTIVKDYVRERRRLRLPGAGLGSPGGAARHWPPGGGRQTRYGCDRDGCVVASIGCSLFWVGFAVSKPLSQIHRSTLLPLRTLTRRPPSVDSG